MTESEVKILVNDVIEKLQIALAEPERNKENIEKIYNMFMNNSLYEEVKKGLLEDSRFQEMEPKIKEILQKQKSEKKDKLLNRILMGGLAGTLLLYVGHELLKHNNVALNNTKEETITDVTVHRIAEPAYDELFNANFHMERIDRIAAFLTEARELGFDDDYFTIEQLNDVYTILNLDSLDPEEYASLSLNMNSELMMEHFADFGAAVGQSVLISNSGEHLNIGDLIANKKDAIYMKNLESLLYRYNDENVDKKDLAENITDLIWDRTVQKQTVGNATQLIGYYLGYQGHELTVNNEGQEILADASQFKEIYSSTGCKLDETSLERKESQFAESYIDTKKALEDFLNLAKDYRPEIERGFIDRSIYEQIKDVKVGVLKDFNYYIHKYSPSFSNPTNKENNFTSEDKKNLGKDENGNTVIIGGETGSSKEEQIEDANKLAALKTEASSAAVRKAEGDAKTGSYDETVPSKYQSVSDAYLESYRQAYSDYKAYYDAIAKEPTDDGNIKEEVIETPKNEETNNSNNSDNSNNSNNEIIDESGVDFGNSDSIVKDEEFITPDQLPEGAEVSNETLALSDLYDLANALRNADNVLNSELTEDKSGIKLTLKI